MNEEQAIDVIANFWNHAGGETRLSMMKTLFDGYPPPRLTSIEELMKLNYPVKKLTAQTSKFMEVFRDERSESERLIDLEANAWPKISDINQRKVFQFLQLSTAERSHLHAMSTPKAITEGNIFDPDVVDIDGRYYDLCDKGQTCPIETPSCITFQGKLLCVKQCVGHPNCYVFMDPSKKRSWPGQCIASQQVCEGFAYFDATQDQDTAKPFGTEATGNGWGIAEAGVWSWSSGSDSSVVQIFSFLLPILLVLCINF